MIDFCKNLNLRILNGRKVDDLYGKFTCFSNGASSVDYGIASEGLFQFISNFSVSRQEIYSDHCEISMSIPGKAFSKINTEAYKWSTMPRPFT